MPLPLSTADIEAATLDQTLQIAKQMTANAADYTFFFVGNIDLATFEPLVAQYIATLPGNAATAVKAPVANADLDLKTGAPVYSETTKMQNPQTYLLAINFADVPYTAKDRAALIVAGQILSQRILNKVREEWGASYSPGAGSQMKRIEIGRAHV